MIRLEMLGEIKGIPGRFIGSLESLLRRDCVCFGGEKKRRWRGELVKE
jgi:hypothetical protein